MFNRKTYVKKCIICGKNFETLCGRALTCGKECRNAYNRVRYKAQRNSIKKDNNLDDVLKKAKEAGMSYGKYVATVERMAK